MSVIKRQMENGTLILKNPLPEVPSRRQANAVASEREQLAEDSTQAEFEHIGLRNFIGASTDEEMNWEKFFAWDGNCDSIIPSEEEDPAEPACDPSVKNSAWPQTPRRPLRS
jgi:hypothetical protein